MSCNDALNSGYVFKPGDDLTWTGQIKIPGVTDYTGYVLSAQIRISSPTDGSPGDLVATPTFAATTALGITVMSVARAVTALWPESSKLMIDIVTTAPSGLKTTSPTAYFATGKRVTAIP